MQPSGPECFLRGRDTMRRRASIAGLRDMSVPQPFDYAEFKRRQYIRKISLDAARKVDPLVRKAMEQAAEQGRAIARAMSEGKPIVTTD